MTLHPWKVLSSKVVYETPWIQVVEDLCSTQNGQEITYTSVKRRDEGSLIIPEDADGRIWMVQQYRHPIKKIVWQFAAGGKEAGESWQHAAERELEEEIGKKAGQMTDLGIFYPDPGLLDQTAHIFLATDLRQGEKKTGDQPSHEVEDLHAQAFSLDEIDHLITIGEVCDGWTLGGFYLYLRYKKQ